MLRAPVRNEMHRRPVRRDALDLRPRLSCLPDLTTYLGFVAAVLMMQAVPGPDTILVAVRGMSQGLRMALYTVLGMTLLAGLVQLPLLALGLGGIARASPVLFAVIQLAGAAYLVWLGLSFIFRATSGLAGTSLPDPPSPRHAMIQGMAINLANPNPLVFLLAFLPQDVDPTRDALPWQILILGRRSRWPRELRQDGPGGGRRAGEGPYRDPGLNPRQVQPRLDPFDPAGADGSSR